MDASLAKGCHRPLSMLAVVLACLAAPMAVHADLLVGTLAPGPTATRATPIGPRPLPAGGRTTGLVYGTREVTLIRRSSRSTAGISPMLALLLVMAQPPPTSMLQNMGIHASSVNGGSLYPDNPNNPPNNPPDGPPTHHMPEPASLVSAALGTLLAVLFALGRRRRACLLRPA